MFWSHLAIHKVKKKKSHVNWSENAVLWSDYTSSQNPHVKNHKKKRSKDEKNDEDYKEDKDSKIKD